MIKKLFTKIRKYLDIITIFHRRYNPSNIAFRPLLDFFVSCHRQT